MYSNHSRTPVLPGETQLYRTALSTPRSRYEAQHGASLLELVATLAVVGLVATLAATHTLHTTRIQRELSREVSATVAVQKTAAAVITALRSLDRHRLPCCVVVQSSDSLTQSTHPVRGLRGTAAPRPRSDIVSVLEVSPLARLRITSGTLAPTSPHLSATTCGDSAALPSPLRSFLVVGLSGVTQITGTLSQISAGCRTVTGTVIERGIFSTETTLRGSQHLLLPVLREYSLFIDRSSQLRLVSHVGGRIIENQPLLRGVSSLHISSLPAEQGLSRYAITVTPLMSRPHTTFFVSSLTRSPLWNQLLP